MVEGAGYRVVHTFLPATPPVAAVTNAQVLQQGVCWQVHCSLVLLAAINSLQLNVLLIQPVLFCVPTGVGLAVQAVLTPLSVWCADRFVLTVSCM